MSGEPIFFDTWGWVAFFNKGDEHHAKTTELWRALRGTPTPLITSWPVIQETVGFACSSRGRREWDKDGGLAVSKALMSFAESELLAAVMVPSETDMNESLQLRVQHGSIPDLSLTDCTIAVMLRRVPRARLLSGDHHFRTLCPGTPLIPASW